MTYARARLWLGISGVGTFVVLATFLLVSRIHFKRLTQEGASFSSALI